MVLGPIDILAKCWNSTSFFHPSVRMVVYHISLPRDYISFPLPPSNTYKFPQVVILAVATSLALLVKNNNTFYLFTYRSFFLANEEPGCLTIPFAFPPFCPHTNSSVTYVCLGENEWPMVTLAATAVWEFRLGYLRSWSITLTLHHTSSHGGLGGKYSFLSWWEQNMYSFRRSLRHFFRILFKPASRGGSIAVHGFSQWGFFFVYQHMMFFYTSHWSIYLNIVSKW